MYDLIGNEEGKKVSKVILKNLNKKLAFRFSFPLYKRTMIFFQNLFFLTLVKIALNRKKPVLFEDHFEILKILQGKISIFANIVPLITKNKNLLRSGNVAR